MEIEQLGNYKITRYKIGNIDARIKESYTNTHSDVGFVRKSDPVFCVGGYSFSREVLAEMLKLLDSIK